MKELFPDLYQTKTYQMGMLNTHAYFLKTPGGNTLIYNAGNTSDLDEMASMGGFTHQLISHRDEVAPSLARIKKRFNSQLICGHKEKRYVEKIIAPDLLVEKEMTLESGVHIFHTPGHSDGHCSFWYQSKLTGLKYFFTGDSFFPWNGKLKTFVIEGFGGTKNEMVRTLEGYLDYQPDVVLCSAAVGDVYVVNVTADEWKSAIEKNIRSLSK